MKKFFSSNNLGTENLCLREELDYLCALVEPLLFVILEQRPGSHSTNDPVTH